MKKIVWLITLTIMSLSSIQAQNKYIKLIEKNKFSKVWKKSEAILSKDNRNIEFNFYQAYIASDPEATSYFNLDLAFNAFCISYDSYIRINDFAELEKLNKVPISLVLYDELLSNILARKYQSALQSEDLAFLEDFLFQFRPERLPAGKRFQLEQYRSGIISHRNNIAFIIAKKTNSIKALKDFIEKYPKAQEVKDAELIIHEIAFGIAIKANTVESLKAFIREYPNADQVKLAWNSIYDLEYAIAERINTSVAWSSYIKTYPNSHQSEQAINNYYLCEFQENTFNPSIEVFGSFIENFPNNPFRDWAVDSLKALITPASDFKWIDYFLMNVDNTNEQLRKAHFRKFTKDGETMTLEIYLAAYPNLVIETLFNEAYYWAKFADGLNLHLTQKIKNHDPYWHYISNNLDLDRSLVVLNRAIQEDIFFGNYSQASAMIKKNLPNVNSDILKILQILDSPIDISVRPRSISNNINSVGNEYAPIPTADEKTLFFCGSNRVQSIGGEDIFYSSKVGKSWSKPTLESFLSSDKSNEAPLSVSADGNTMILFKNGKLLYSQRGLNNWSNPVALPNVFNAGEWQGDAMIASDGKAILFSAVIPSLTLNKNQLSDKFYHGDRNYPTDMYVSLMDSSGNWSNPIHLGNIVNTGYSERYPFLHPDMKTLYFSSDGFPGIGKMDVYKSTRLSDTCWDCWSEPVNLGKEINTGLNDAGYKVSTSGEVAYFTKNKAKIQNASVLFVLDISGSMSGSKIDELKISSINAAEDVISNQAEVAIVAFSGDCNAPLSGWLPFTKNYQDVRDFVNSLNAGGGTPMYPAYFQASTALMKLSNPRSEKVIVLMTDGDANGCSDLYQTLTSLKKTGQLYKTQTIAYAVDSNSQAYKDLELIANISGGNFFFASGTSDLGAAFERANSTLFNIVSGSENQDIYEINLPPHLRPDFVAKIEGKLLDEHNRPIDANISWEDLEKGQLIGAARSNPSTGEFFITLPLGKNYGYYVEDNKYFPLSQNIDLRNANSAVNISKDFKVISLDSMIVNGVSVPLNNLFFEFGKAELLFASRQELKRVSVIIKKLNIPVEISGHTDIIGTENANQRLSENRAQNVADYLIQLGCPKELFTVVGFGASRPIATNDSDQGRALNRRVEIRFLP